MGVLDDSYMQDDSVKSINTENVEKLIAGNGPINQLRRRSYASKVETGEDNNRNLCEYDSDDNNLKFNGIASLKDKKYIKFKNINGERKDYFDTEQEYNTKVHEKCNDTEIDKILNNDQPCQDSKSENGKFWNFCSSRAKKLLRLEQMPEYLQFNKFIHTGYRELQSAWDCVLSLFYLHNETVNIFTHVIPIIVVIYYWRSMYPWEEIKGHKYFNFLGWSHVLGSISPWLGSVVYHLFMNHIKGARFYTILLQMDMFGIWIAQCFGAMTNITASTWCLSDQAQMMWLAIYGIAAVFGLYKAVTAQSALGRRLCFGLVFVSRIFGFALRLSSYGGGDPSVLTHVVLQDLISAVGGMIGVIRIPELWFPGKLDLFCNSHHIMHVMVVLAVFHMNIATNGDIQWILDNYSKSQCKQLF